MTIFRMRSTSPPKSAWPGVSTMLILVSLVPDGGVLGQDGDAPLPLQVAGVHHPVHHLLVLPVDAALLEHLVHQGGLAVVDVGDDGNVSQAVSFRKIKGPFLMGSFRIYRFTHSQFCIICPLSPFCKAFVTTFFYKSGQSLEHFRQNARRPLSDASRLAESRLLRQCCPKEVLPFYQRTGKIYRRIFGGSAD